MSNDLSGIYLPLDVILDTRIGTVMKVAGPDVAAQVLAGNYHSREDDNFPGVDVGGYKTAYAARDLETLTLSTLTNIVSFLREIISTLLKQALHRPYHKGVRIVVNTYPYQLPEGDTEQILEVLAAKLKGFTDLEIPFKLESVHISEQALTPEYCKSNFSAMLMYDYDKWLSTQQQAILKAPLKEVTLFAPALYTVHTPTKAELDKIREETDWVMHPFEAFERAVSGGILLKLLPIELFSVVKPT